jgi:hypothetical protein
LGASACADDTAAQPSDAGDPDRAADGGDQDSDPADAGPDDATGSILRDAAITDAGLTQTEPPLTIPQCGPTDRMCCPSALGFEDGNTEHFQPAACCKLALSNPRLVMSPTACGAGALQLDADFRATSPASRCGAIDEEEACSYQTGEISRPVLAPLDLTDLTMSAAVRLEGPSLPAGPVDAQLFVLGRGGLIEGPLVPISGTGLWSAVEFRIVDDGSHPGADIRLIGLRIAFHGQAWTGQALVDEFSWY